MLACGLRTNPINCNWRPNPCPSCCRDTRSTEIPKPSQSCKHASVKQPPWFPGLSTHDSLSPQHVLNPSPAKHQFLPPYKLTALGAQVISHRVDQRHLSKVHAGPRKAKIAFWAPGGPSTEGQVVIYSLKLWPGSCCTVSVLVLRRLQNQMRRVLLHIHSLSSCVG